VLSGDTVAGVDLDAWSLPPVFCWLSGQAGLAEDEVLKTFNCGIGMVLVVEPEAVETITATLTQAGEHVVRIGKLAEGAGPAIRYRGTLG